MNIRSIVKTTRLSWREHKGVQLATLIVLSATFTVVISFATISENLRHLLHAWGDSLQMTAYLKDGLSEKDVSSIRQSLTALAEFKNISFVSKDEAKDKFAKQMSNYAPTLLADGGMENPFPASFQIVLPDEKDAAGLSYLSAEISKITGVEEVSYGEDWIQNYSSLVHAFEGASWVIALVLMLGSFLVVSNSIRASIDRRRDEIDILRLVGATESMIRQPFIFEGALMGLMATCFGLAASYGFYVWSASLFSQNLAFSNVASNLHFLTVPAFLAVVFFGVTVGAAGSFACVFRLKSLSYASKGQ